MGIGRISVSLLSRKQTRFTGGNMRRGIRADAADMCRRGRGLLRRILCVPIGRTYGGMLEKGDVPEEDEDEVEEEGKAICGCIAEDGVGGGASKALAFVFRVVGESVDMSRAPPRHCAGSD